MNQSCNTKALLDRHHRQKQAFSSNSPAHLKNDAWTEYISNLYSDEELYSLSRSQILAAYLEFEDKYDP